MRRCELHQSSGIQIDSAMLPLTGAFHGLANLLLFAIVRAAEKAETVRWFGVYARPYTSVSGVLSAAHCIGPGR